MTLVAFDFDNTLSDSRMLVLLCRRCGVSEENRGITKRVRTGELGYTDSLRERVSLLSGHSEDDVHAVCERIDLRPGVTGLLEEGQRADVTTAIISGGFRRCIEQVLDRSGVAVDHLRANQLVIRDGTVTGEVTGPLVKQRKDTVLRDLTACSHEQIVAVGDGPTDRPMLKTADISIGFRPESEIRQHCEYTVTDIHQLRKVLESESIM